MGRCTILTAGDKAKKKRRRSIAVEEKWRVPQEEVDFILSWDVSRHVSRAPDNLDNISASEEFRESYRALKLKSVALMAEIRRTRGELQEFVRAQFEEHGYVEVNSEMFAKYQRERQEQFVVDTETA